MSEWVVADFMNACFLWQTQIVESLSNENWRIKAAILAAGAFLPFVARPWRSEAICCGSWEWREIGGNSQGQRRWEGIYQSGLEEIAGSHQSTKKSPKMTQAKASHPKQAMAHDVMVYHVISEMSIMW